MINYNINTLIDKTLKRFYETYSITLDTDDFVNPKTNSIICKFIDKNLKKKLKEICKEDKIYQRNLKKKLRKSKPSTVSLFFKKLFGKRIVKEKETDK